MLRALLTLVTARFFALLTASGGAALAPQNGIEGNSQRLDSGLHAIQLVSAQTHRGNRPASTTIASRAPPAPGAGGPTPQARLAQFRERFAGIFERPDLSPFDAANPRSGTAAFVEVGGRRFFGLHGSAVPSTLPLRRNTFARIQETLGLHRGKNLNAAQSLSHAEGIALQRAEAAMGSLKGQRLTIHVDRTTCALCRNPNGLARLKQLFELEDLRVIDAEGIVSTIK